MKILLALNSKIPVVSYGGPERIVWWLGKELSKLGHEITYLVKKGSECPFAKVLVLDEKKPLQKQIPKEIDIAHFHYSIEETLETPTIITSHQNSENTEKRYHPNTVFLSQDHAWRHGGQFFIHNGLDFSDYGEPMLDNSRKYVHFLGNAALRVKNLKGAINIASAAGERLHVLGGSRINLRAGMRITLNPNVRFHGMLGGQGKNVLLNGSKALIFPVLWHEPFGLGILESLYFGCPVFGTPFGSLPELLGMHHRHRSELNGKVDAFFSDYGVLSTKTSELAEAVKRVDDFNRKKCHDYVVENFNAARMTQQYLAAYSQILDGESLHQTEFVQGPESTVAEPILLNV